MEYESPADAAQLVPHYFAVPAGVGRRVRQPIHHSESTSTGSPHSHRNPLRPNHSSPKPRNISRKANLFPRLNPTSKPLPRSLKTPPSMWLWRARRSLQVNTRKRRKAPNLPYCSTTIIPSAHAVRAWALDFQGETLEAEASIKRALELDPNNALAHAYYAEILVDSFYSGTGAVGAIEKAIEESKVAIALAPDTLETHRARGYVLEATGNYEEAIREYEAAIAINPNIADLHLRLGSNYRTLGIYDKAVEEFTRANALNPEDPTPDLFISRTYATIGEYAKAMQYAESAKTTTLPAPACAATLA